jgi:16S rRNA (cytidine1402-2'-O)-methyltransferase
VAGHSPEQAAPQRLGRLYLVPNTLDLGAAPVDLQQVLPLGVLQRAAILSHWVAENAKSTRALLSRVHALVPLAHAMQALDIRELPRAPKDGRAAPDGAAWRALLAPALQGHDIGLISEAGLPAVADPGASLVEAAHGLGLQVLPLAGPSSLLLALAGSGLNGQSFAFVGYLPVQPAARSARIQELEARSRREAQTQLIIETPYRNQALLAALLGGLSESTRLSVACGLTLEGGWVRTCTVAEWRRHGGELPERVPAVFSLLAG